MIFDQLIILDGLFEGLFGIFSAIFSAIGEGLAVLAEFISGFFVAAGETYGILDLFVILFIVFIETVVWILMLAFELLVSLFQRRKPKVVKKPKFWRPKTKTVREKK